MSHRGCLLLLVFLAGCAQSKTPQSGSTPAFRAMGQSIEAGETHSDEAIGLEIRHRLAAEIPAESAGVIIEISDGIVTLRGFAPTQAAAWRVTAVVHSVKGVKQVGDQLILKARPVLP